MRGVRFFRLLLVCTACLMSWFPRVASAQGTYESPFSITLSADIGAWTSDFAARRAAIDTYATPTQADWYFPTIYEAPSFGPLNPQLYSTSVIGQPSAANQLQSDRGNIVLNVPLNTRPAGVDQTVWQQQRLLAAANELLQAGTPYQHLHLPNFDPASVTSGTGFPWSPVSDNPYLKSSYELANHITGTTPNPYLASYGKPQAGIDCTDFSAYVYSLALGVQMHSGVVNQIEFVGSVNPAPGVTGTATVLDTAGNTITPTFIYGPNFGTATLNAPNSLDTLVSQFQTGDLLYIGDPTKGILHVVMWLGQSGTDSAGNVFPLVISSHDNTPAIFDTLALTDTGYPIDGDITGHLPPPGVHILPFASSNWFYQDFQVAMRVIGTASVPEIDPTGAGTGLALVAGVLGLLERRRRRGPVVAPVGTATHPSPLTPHSSAPRNDLLSCDCR